MISRIQEGRIYKHFKGDSYIVLCIATDSETLEPVVVYRALYDYGKIFVRSKKDFLSLVDTTKYPNATQKYKFELQKIKSVRD